MKICPVCKKTSEKGSYCTKCGSPLVDLPEEDRAYDVNEKESPSKSGKNKIKKPSKIELAVICLAMLLCIAFVIGLFWVQSNNKKDESDFLSEIKKEESDTRDQETESSVQTEKSDTKEETEEQEETEKQEESAEIAPKKEFEHLDVEAEVEQIRTWYYSPTESEEKFVLNKGTDGWNYSREYYFHDGALFFAFIYNGTEEHRLYFKDDVMIRYIDENKNVYDYGNTSRFSDWESRALQESRQFSNK